MSTDSRWRDGVTRRQALLSLAGMLSSSPLLRAQRDPRPLGDHRRRLQIEISNPIRSLQSSISNLRRT
jgi:hypothetical protein